MLLPLGTNPDGSHFFTGIRNVDATLIGSKWGTTNLTFSFPTSGTNYNGSVPIYDGVGNYHIDLGTQQQAAARAALAQLAAVSGLTFTEITETDTVHANIRISQTADQDVPSAYGTFPSDKVIASGDIWFGRNNQPYYDLAFKGTWGFATMMHEIGHTMGLKHGHQDYTNLDLSSSFGTSPRFGTQSLTPDRDGQAWSLMTYTPAPFTNSAFAGDKISQPQTYMQYDLAALQYLYGANFNTNSGDSVYTFSQTTGEMFINGVGQGAPAGNRIFLTIWDGGGNDTIDASNYANGVTIDLRPGEFSTFDQAQLVNNLAAQNLVNLAPGNIAMSLLYNNDARSLIENATGGVGNDIFVGNTANNVLDGGAGSDSVIFTNPTGVNVTLNDVAADVIVTHDGETDTLRSIENIGGTSGNDTITGNSQDNVLTGGSGGADNLSGGDGNDRLVGGGFTTTTTFSAPSQPDITKPQSTNNNSIATAVATAGFFDVDANPDITNATSIPHATINATAFGGSVEYYRIDVTVAGSTAIFDIDGGGTLDDSIIELVNSGGTLLATNDTGTGDVTFPGHDDAYLTFTFNTVGTFYIRVGRFISNSVAQPLIAGQTYQLNISLQNAAVVTTTVTANNTSSLVADGGEGNDVVVGTLGNDTLTGGNGNDTASFVNAFNSASNGLSTTGVTVDLNVQGVGPEHRRGRQRHPERHREPGRLGPERHPDRRRQRQYHRRRPGHRHADRRWRQRHRLLCRRHGRCDRQPRFAGLGAEHGQCGLGFAQRVRKPGRFRLQRQPHGRRQRQHSHGWRGRRHAQSGCEPGRHRGPAGRRDRERHRFLRGYRVRRHGHAERRGRQHRHHRRPGDRHLAQHRESDRRLGRRHPDRRCERQRD